MSKERELLRDTKQNTSEYLNQLLSLRRPKVSNDTMANYLSRIDFSKFKNKLAAIGMLKREFGEKNVDSDEAKKLIMSKF